MAKIKRFCRIFSSLAYLSLIFCALYINFACSTRDMRGEKYASEQLRRTYSKSKLSDKIIEGARLEVKTKPYYRSRYIENGGFPPSTEGVCTDLLWRAFAHSGYPLKSMIDLDISLYPQNYPRIKGKANPNIDFRRVPNLKVFFEKYAEVLSTEIIIGDLVKLSNWRAGDIVTFKNPDHIAIISPRRNALGVPYLIHNPGPRPVEADDLWPLYNKKRLTGHYRFPSL